MNKRKFRAAWRNSKWDILIIGFFVADAILLTVVAFRGLS